MKALARLVFLAGAIGIGLFLFRAAPRDLTLVYGLGGGPARSLEVEIRRGVETVRHAEFRFADAPASVSHRVRLTDGDYTVHATVRAEGASREVDRPLTVTESGTIVIPLGW